MTIKDHVSKVKQDIATACAHVGRSPEEITVVGVTKYVDHQMAKELMLNGVTNLGENRPDVFLKKYQQLNALPIWHFIGTLQTRQVREVINKVDYLHSLDRLSLAHEIQKRADQKINCFVQVNVAQEASKHGLAAAEVIDFMKQLSDYDKIEVVGLMTMAPLTEDVTVIRSCFSTLRRLQMEVQKLSLVHAPCTALSMGMTNDYKIAIEEGATFIRLGRCLIKGDE